MTTRKQPKRFKGREYTTESGLWRYRVGRKGINLVKVYERTPGGSLHVELWVPGPDGRREKRRHALTNSAGERVFDRTLAMEIADYMSDRQWEQAHARTMEEILGRPAPRTLRQLLAELHATRSAEWSPVHRKDQERLRSLWLATLGPDTLLSRISDALVVQKAREVAEARDWSPRRHARFIGYMREAFKFGADELKWLKQDDKLTAAKSPKVRRGKKDRQYSVEEVRALLSTALNPANGVDLRVTAALAIACMTGRRINAIRTLATDAYRTEAVRTDAGIEQVGVIEFPAETDKAREEGRAFLRGPIKAVVDRLAATPAARASGMLFPSGDLGDTTKRRPYAADTWLTDKLHELEKLAGVPYIEGRAWHGFKKFFATVVEPSLAADQSGTDEATLRRWYRSPQDARRMAAAQQVNVALRLA